MRTSLIGSAAAIIVGLSLSGCATEGGQSTPAPEHSADHGGDGQSGAPKSDAQSQSGEADTGNETIEQDAQQSAEPDSGDDTAADGSGDNGLSTEDRPCNGTDLTGEYRSWDVEKTHGSGVLSVTGPDPADPCVLTDYPEVQVLGEDGEPLPVSVRTDLPPAPSRVELPAESTEQAQLNIEYTAPESPSCDGTPDKLVLNLGGDDTLEVPVNAVSEDVDGLAAMCEGAELHLSGFEAAVS